MRAALALFFALGCATPPPTKAPSPAPLARATPPEWRVARYPRPPQSATLIERASDGTERLLVGSFRVERHGAQVTFSADATLENISKSCPSDGGYLHFTESDRLLWSPTFLGKLSPVGLASEGASGRVVQCGPVVVAFSERLLPFQVLSRHGVRTLDRSHDFAMLRFSTESLGRAIRSPDRLFETRDGGRTFVEAKTRPQGKLDDPDLWLGGTFAPTPWNEVSGANADNLLSAWVRRAVASDAGALAGGLILSDGTWVRTITTGSERQYVAFRTPDGKVSDYRIDGACRLSPWGEKLVADCYQGEPGIRLLTRERQEALPQPPFRPEQVVADPKGRWIAALAWPSAESDGVKGSALMRFDGERWHVHASLHVEPRAIRNGWLVATDSPHSSSLLSLTDPEHGARSIPGEYLAAGEVSLLDDRFAYLRRDGEGKNDPKSRTELTWLGLASKGAGDARAYPISNQLERIGFADERHGVALASPPAAAMVTTDSGRSFTELMAYENLGLHAYDKPRCWARGCAFGESVAWTDQPFRSEPFIATIPRPEPDLAPATQAPAAAAATSTPPEPRSPTTPLETSAPLYVCAATPPLPIKSFEESLWKFSKDSKSVGRVPAVGGLFERLNGGLVWNGHDSGGDFRTETPALTGVASGIASPSSKLLNEVVPELVTRRFAVVLRVADASSEGFVVHADGRTERFVASADHVVGLTAIPLPGGGAALLVGGSPGNLIHLDANGEVVAHRWFISWPTLLTLSATGPSFSVQKGERAEVFSLVPGSPGRDIAFRPKDNHPECTKPPAGDALVFPVADYEGPRIAVDGKGSVPPVYPEHWAPPSTALGLLEVGTSGSCWRGAFMGIPFPTELHAERGAMRGTLVGPNHTHTLSCRRVKGRK